VKRRDLERYLRAQGCRQASEGGNHSRWISSLGALSVVPRHREIDFVVVRKICRQLEVRLPTGSR
jgi:HicA-like toxin of HicAB toxin-antitoxin system